MKKVNPTTWMMSKDLEAGDYTIHQYDRFTVTVSSCIHCMDKLMQRSKEELVTLVLDTFAPVLTKGQIWSRVMRLAASTEEKLRKFN